MALVQDLSANLREIRRRHDLSLTEFAEEISIGRSTLHSIESGRLNTTLGTVDQIADRLQIPAYSLLVRQGIESESGAVGFLWFAPGTLEQLPVQKRERIMEAIQLLLQEVPTLRAAGR